MRRYYHSCRLSAIALCAWYAMFGTDILRYCPMRVVCDVRYPLFPYWRGTRLSSTDILYYCPMSVVLTYCAFVLCTWYAMSGTDLYYGSGIVHVPARLDGMHRVQSGSVRYAPTRVSLLMILVSWCRVTWTENCFARLCAMRLPEMRPPLVLTCAYLHTTTSTEMRVSCYSARRTCYGLPLLSQY